MDKEQLKEAVGELNLVDTVFEADGVSYIDTAVSVTQVYDLIDQLEEPEKVVIPQFVADWYEQEGSRRKWWNWFYKWGGNQSDSRTVLEKRALEWMQDFNEGLFVDIFRYGYEIEKEKLYVVVLSNSNEKFGTYENVFLNKKDGVAFIDSCRLFINDIKKHSQFALTEKQIKDYDPRFMAFAEEVTE